MRSTAELTESFRDHYRLLWGICYRMTGSASDAEDIVQDAFARALEKPPRGELRPWLITVAMNLGRDLLRRRKRRGYVGPWLPEPVELGADGLAPGDGATRASPSARYELLESASFAFLVALEALTPQQRAVLLLRDVLDYSVRETAAALTISEPNVKTTLHRARKSMATYDAKRAGRADAQRASEALRRFLFHVAAQNLDEVERLLAEDCVALSDGGGEYFAARVPIVGRAKIAKFYRKVSAMRPLGGAFDVRILNGAPALLASWPDAPAGQAPRVVSLVDVSADGTVTQLYSVLKSEKIRALFQPA